jgi:uncharacterized protein DUF2442
MKEYPHHLDVTFAEPTADFCLRLGFSDGVVKEVYVWDLLEGPVFEPLKNPAYFRQVTLDCRSGTVVWPNGADFAPEALWELPDLAKA